MTDEPQVEVWRVLPRREAGDAGVGPGNGVFTLEESKAILEVAYLATAADDDLSEEEVVAFQSLATSLRGLVGPEAGEGDVTPAELDAMLDEFASHIEHHTSAERLVVLAPLLARPIAKDTAYKVSFAMALCDLAENDDEEDFDDELVAALGLSEDHADELAAEVYEAIGGEEEDL